MKVGGMERIACELSNYFSDKVDTHLVILGKNDQFYKLAEDIQISSPSFSTNGQNKFVSIFKTITFLRKELKNIKPDAVLSLGEMYNSFVLLATIGMNIKVFVSDRTRPDKDWGVLHNNLRKYVYRRARGIICQTDFSKRHIHGLTHHKNIHVIPNPSYPFELPKLEKKKVVLTVGRLIATKKVDVLIKLFDDISSNGWELWIVGDGPERASLEKVAKDVSQPQNIKFWGSRRDVVSFYAQASIFAFTSISEGFPNVLLESLTAGLPTIAFDCIAGPADLIEDGVNGFLIPEMDIESYKFKLSELMDNQEVRTKFSEAAKLSKQKYHIDKVGDHFLTALSS